MISTKIEQLPDYPAITQLASALYKTRSGKQGAAVMVGAGFSRAAGEHPDVTKKMPLWYQLAAEMQQKMTEQNSNLTDALRIAEHFRAYCGDNALNDLIRCIINDKSWQPGNLHSDLLSLPWVEVLTTNWDTLLERAVEKNNALVYQTVAREKELAYVCSPRITKLHGSIGKTDDFIVSQEDYRTYPTKYPAFVNFVRQVLIENELCLIGFSGDDPNFIQWIGWVRDQLQQHSKKIYLVGALALSTPQRKYLESINIAPIDLSDCVKDIDSDDLKHKKATELFLQHLVALAPKKPRDWKPETVSNEQNINNFANVLNILKTDRESYPGWLICPREIAASLKRQIFHYCNEKNFTKLAVDQRAGLLYEIMWRKMIAFSPLEAWQVETLIDMIEKRNSTAITKKALSEMLLWGMRLARWQTANQTNMLEYAEKLFSMFESFATELPDHGAEVSYYKALLALEAMDYEELNQQVEHVKGNDLIWPIRKGMLLGELGEYAQGAEVVKTAYKNARIAFNNEPNSIAILQRLSLAHMFLEVIEIAEYSRLDDQNLGSHFREFLCEPWNLIDRLREIVRNEVDKYQDSIVPVAPLFDPGTYEIKGVRVNFDDMFLTEFTGVVELSGLPVYWHSVNVMGSMLQQVLSVKAVTQELYYCALVVRSTNHRNDKKLEHMFSRLMVAKLDLGKISILVKRLKKAINYWVSKIRITDSARHSQKLGVLVEILVRCSIRLSIEESMSNFKWAVELALDKTVHCHLVSKSLLRLAQNSLQSIPDKEQPRLLTEFLMLPVDIEIRNLDDGWSRLRLRGELKRDSNPTVDKRIRQLIENIPQCKPNQTDSLVKLLYLIEQECLTDEEKNILNNYLWKSEQLPDFEVFPQAWLLIPNRDLDKTKSLIQHALFEGVTNLDDVAYLDALANAGKGDREPKPTAEQATQLFSCLVGWSPPKEQNNNPFYFLFDKNRHKRLEASLLSALSYTIVPNLPLAELSESHFEKLLTLHNKTSSAILFTALVYFLINLKNKTTLVEELICQAMRSTKEAQVKQGSMAIIAWLRLAKTNEMDKPEKALGLMLHRLVFAPLTGLAHLLAVVLHMQKEDVLPEEGRSMVAQALPLIFKGSNYDDIEEESIYAAIAAPSIRQSCVELAVELVRENIDNRDELQQIIEQASKDPMPEVRFAELNINSRLV